MVFLLNLLILLSTAEMLVSWQHYSIGQSQTHIGWPLMWEEDERTTQNSSKIKKEWAKELEEEGDWCRIRHRCRISIKRAALTLLKSSEVALISFQVLLRSWIQLQKNSSNERSWVKNMGWKSWQFSLAVNKHMGQSERFVHLSNIAPQSTWGKLIYQVKHQYSYHMTKQCPIFRLIRTGVSRELLTLQLGLWARTFKEAHVSVFSASFSPHVDGSCIDTSDIAGNEWCYLTTHLSERASWQSRRLFSSMRSMRLALRTPTHLKWMWTVG